MGHGKVFVDIEVRKFDQLGCRVAAIAAQPADGKN